MKTTTRSLTTISLVALALGACGGMPADGPVTLSGGKGDSVLSHKLLTEYRESVTIDEPGLYQGDAVITAVDDEAKTVAIEVDSWVFRVHRNQAVHLDLEEVLLERQMTANRSAYLYRRVGPEAPWQLVFDENTYIENLWIYGNGAITGEACFFNDKRLFFADLADIAPISDASAAADPQLSRLPSIEYRLVVFPMAQMIPIITKGAWVVGDRYPYKLSVEWFR